MTGPFIDSDRDGALFCSFTRYRDKDSILKGKIRQEQEVNNALHDRRKTCSFEGALIEQVGTRHRYRVKETEPATIFPNIKYTVVHENVEVYREDEYTEQVTKVYSNVDENIYRVCMEDLSSENLPGESKSRISRTIKAWFRYPI